MNIRLSTQRSRAVRVKLGCVASALLGVAAISPALASPLCAAGSYSATGAAPCTAAPVGSFVSTVGATFATLSPVGFFVATTGASSATQAAPGRYVSTTGASAATLAAPGSYVPTSGASAATLAVPGSYVPGSGATSALLAPAGSYVSGAGAAAATPAPVGSYVNTAGAVAATPAPLGTFVAFAGSTSAQAAPAGSYVGTVGASAATLAPPGSFVSTTGASSPSTAPIGSYAAGQGNVAATACPAGSNAYGAAPACRITSAGFSGAATVGVGPQFNTDHGTSGSFGLGTPGAGVGFGILVSNDSHQLGYASSLTDLTLRNVTLGGVDAGLFALDPFDLMKVLHEGESYLITLRSLVAASAPFALQINFLTDQLADVGQAGQTFSLGLTGGPAVGNVSEPPMLGLLAFAAAASAWVRRKRRPALVRR